MNRWWLPACLAVALSATACGDPPSKEMNQAQGAIDAARAAGADKYAAAEFNAALESLKRSDQAVTEGDYRLALNNALESREHAQNAAREAADTKARLRGEAERTMAEIAALLAEANARVRAAERARLPRRVLRRPQEELAAVNRDVQKAGEAIKADDYVASNSLLDGVKARIERILADFDTSSTSQSTRRRR
jgi:hypothetical protein